LALLKKARINSGGRENSKNDGISADFSWRNPGIFLCGFVTWREINLFSVDPVLRFAHCDSDLIHRSFV